MTFEEYLKQEYPKKLPIHSVIIKMSEFWEKLVMTSTPLHFKWAGKDRWTRTVSFNYKGAWFTYRTDNDDDGNLWTIDEHSNKKARSVFKIENIKEEKK